MDLSDAEYNSPYKLWKRTLRLILKDSIKIKFDKVWTTEIKDLLKGINLESPEKLKAFIDNSKITQTDSSGFSKATIIYSEINAMKEEKEQIIRKIFLR